MCSSFVSFISKWYKNFHFFLRFVIMVMVFNATFNNISVILWQSVLLVEETGVSLENHQPAASHWQTLSHNAELSKSLSCLSDNRSGRCEQCIKHLPDLYFFYDFNWITHILAKSITWFVYSFKWYLGILKVSTTHFCVTCGNIYTIQ